MKKSAPWTQDEVDSLNACQADGRVHEFTSVNGHILIATLEGWLAVPGGEVVQTWAHSFMCDWSWQRFFDPVPLPKTFA